MQTSARWRSLMILRTKLLQIPIPTFCPQYLYLERGRAPVDKAYGPCGHQRPDRVVNVLRIHISAVEQATARVSSGAWIALHHLERSIECMNSLLFNNRVLTLLSCAISIRFGLSLQKYRDQVANWIGNSTESDYLISRLETFKRNLLNRHVCVHRFLRGSHRRIGH